MKISGIGVLLYECTEGSGISGQEDVANHSQVHMSGAGGNEHTE